MFYRPHLQLDGAQNEATSMMTFIRTCGFLDCQIDGHWLEGTNQSHVLIDFLILIYHTVLSLLILNEKVTR